MTQTSCPWFRIAHNRPRRSVGPRLGDALESRALLSITNLSANASPAILRQINPMNQPHAVQVAVIRPVTIAGYASVDGTLPPTLTFRVVDEYGHDQPSGTFTPEPANQGRFFFTARIGLSRRVKPGNRDGRQYTILVNAQDPGSSRTVSIPVSTPVHHPGHGNR